MYQIRQFKPTLYTLLLLGMIGFAVAAQSIVALALGCGGVLINGWLVYSGYFRPLPRLIANIVTVTALFVVVRQLTLSRAGASALDPGGNPVLIIGHFLVVLQLVKLWEQRLNRDYGQLLVLSLLLMVAAAINTNLLAFGLLLVAYLFLSLYCCLLFHLKVETDKAREAAQLSPPLTGSSAKPLPASPDPAASASAMPRPEERQMVWSMRRMAGVIAFYSLITAIITFLFFPRNTTGGILSQAQFSHTLAQTGFSEGLTLEPYSSLQTDDQIIAHVGVKRNGTELGPGSTVYLRGISMNSYHSIHARGFFKRLSPDFQAMSVPAETEIALRRPHRTNNPAAIPLPASEELGTTFTQNVVLSPTGTRVLFFVSATGASGQRSATPFSLYAHREVRIKVGEDGAVQTEEPLSSPIEYDGSSDDRAPVVVGDWVRSSSISENRGLFPDLLVTDWTRDNSTARPGVPSIPAGTLGMRVTSGGPIGLHLGDLIVAVDGRPVSDFPADTRADQIAAAHQAARSLTIVHQGNSLVIPSIPLEVAEYARRPDVSGSDAQGSFAARRQLSKYPDPLDAEIARSIERHLRSQFSYTMDISDAKTRADLDPIVWFLSEDGRRGHCEYFAAAMTLMCQSLGLQARVVSGYRCDEFNDFSHRFVVRQSQAHAWVEVLTSDGWRTFDPTSGRDASANQADSSLWQKVKHLFDWLESSYANHVLYYNNESRDNLIQSMETQMTKPLYRAVNNGWITSRFKDSKLYQMISDPRKGPVPWVVAAVAVLVGTWWGRRIWRHWKLRKRVERIGLDALPAAERLRLVRQLGFYDDLLRMLEKRRIYREAHQTPQEFARSLLYLPADVYEAILRLTSIFYRVRFGQQSLSSGLQHRLQSVITRLDGELTGE